MTQVSATLPAYDQIRRSYRSLVALEAEAKSYQSNTDRRFCANAVWYDRPRWGRSLRDRVIAVADRAVKRYGQQQVYDVIYSAIYDRLPDCRECGCFDRGDL